MTIIYLILHVIESLLPLYSYNKIDTCVAREGLQLLCNHIEICMTRIFIDYGDKYHEYLAKCICSNNEKFMQSRRKPQLPTLFYTDLIYRSQDRT